jgi:uncharacterized membrane protein YdcZ (DUF606 family)
MPIKTTGIVLMVIGVLMFAYTGFNYVTTERVVDLGPIKVDAKKNHRVQWPPIIGVMLVIGGTLVLTRGKKTI